MDGSRASGNIPSYKVKPRENRPTRKAALSGVLSLDIQIQ